MFSAISPTLGRQGEDSTFPPKTNSLAGRLVSTVGHIMHGQASSHQFIKGSFGPASAPGREEDVRDILGFDGHELAR